jgi:gliding motility-associated protein GldE
LESDQQLSILSSFSGITSGNTVAGVLIYIFLLLALILGSAMMSASEAAFFSFKIQDIKKLRSEKNKSAKSAVCLYDNPERLLSTILVLENIFNISFLFIGALLSFKLFDGGENITAFFIGMVVLTLFLLLFGEVMPKIYATKNYMTVALSMAVTLTILQKIFYPLTTFVVFSSSFLKRKKSNASDEVEPYGFESGSESLDEDEKILKGIASFGNTNVSAIMCPRIDVTAIDIRSGFDKIIPVIINSSFSRIPVYSGSFDSVRGILYAKDVLPYTNHPSTFKWQTLLRPSYFVPETKKINDLLKEFQLRKIHMAVVIDEYGGTSGIVTLEDILEEIVGDITDESDEDETLYRRLNDHSYIFDGKILLHDFCRVMGVEENIFEEVRGESETLAGLMLELTGEIPIKDQHIDYNEFRFRIEAVDKRRVKEIFVELKKKEDSEAI